MGQVQPLIVLWSNVTEPVCASARPVTVAPVVIVIEVEASMFPKNVVFVPRVAELPTCQYMLQALAWFFRSTLPVTVVRVEDGIWKIQIASGFPCASSVRVPAEIKNDETLDR